MWKHPSRPTRHHLSISSNIQISHPGYHIVSSTGNIATEISGFINIAQTLYQQHNYINIFHKHRSRPQLMTIGLMTVQRYDEVEKK